MRILLDHNLPQQIRNLLSAHTVSSARDNGWDALVNGDLLVRAEASGYDCLLTGDRNLGYQNHLPGRKIAIVVVNVTNRRVLSRQIATVIAALAQIRPGQYVEVTLERPTLRRRGYPGPA